MTVQAVLDPYSSFSWKTLEVNDVSASVRILVIRSAWVGGFNACRVAYTRSFKISSSTQRTARSETLGVVFNHADA